VANKEVDIIEGEVTQAYTPSKNNEGKWRPANIIIQRDDGSQATIKQFPKSDYDTRVTHEPIQMPPWYEALDFDNLIGCWVQVAAVHSGEYNGIAQYDSVKTFKVASTSSLPKPQPRTAQPQTAKPSTADENQMRIMRQSTLGYSATLLAGKEFASPEIMIEQTIQVASKLLEYVISGEMPSFVDEEAEADMWLEQQEKYDEQPDEQQAGVAMFDLFGNAADDGVLPVE